MQSSIWFLPFCACLFFGDALNVHNADGVSTISGEQDLVMMHVPMNFGNSIALTAAVGSGSKLSYGQVTGSARAGWSQVNALVQPSAPVWGPLNPDLQQKSEMGYPMYYTPAKYWPEALAKQYFGDKTVFGVLRDPYERFLGVFRSQCKLIPSGGRGWNFRDDGKNCAAELNAYTKKTLSPLVQDPSTIPTNPNLHVQADYFEGPYAIQEVIDLDTFPKSANKLLQEHGYNIDIGVDDMMHVSGCDATYVDDFDEESKNLIEQYYARDFKLRCDKLGYCDKTQYHCTLGCPGMCPQRLYTWDDGARMYSPK